MRDRASELRAIADGRLMLNVRNGVTVSRSMLAMIADEIDALRAAPLAPAEVGGHADAQTEARASLWVTAKPEHAKLGWTYDFEQTERISNAAYEGTGYGATMEVVEFVMAEADRRHATALTAKDAELAEARAQLQRQFDQTVRFQGYLVEAKAQLASVKSEAIAATTRYQDAENEVHNLRVQLAEARKALEPFALVAEHDISEDEADSDPFRPMPKPFNHAPRITVGHLRAARRAREQGGE